MHHSLHKAPAGSTVARTLTLLVLVHFAAGWVLGWLTQSSLPTFIACVYLGLFHSQTGLLGVWGGLGPNAWPIRLFGLLTGVAYLAPQLCFGLDEWSLVVVLIVFFSTMGLAAVLLGVRWRKGSIRRMRPHDFSEPEGLQFSIGHLMLLTVGVALLIMVGKMIHPLLRGRLELAIVIAYSLCFISVALLCTWAMLGRGNILMRCLIAVAVSVALGFAPAAVVNLASMWRFWVVLTCMQAVFLLASLLVVRWCGYRMLSRPQSQAG